MKRIRNMTFEELVKENMEKLLNDPEILDRLEERWELRHVHSEE